MSEFSYDDVMDGIGEQEEFGGDATMLPVGYYPMLLAVRKFDSWDPTSDDPRPSPFVQMSGVIQAGPWEGVETFNRQNLSPGGPNSKGGLAPYLRNMAHQITGQKVDNSAMQTAGFTFTSREPADVMAQFRDQFNKLSAADKKAFMRVWMRVAELDGKQCIVKVGLRERTKKVKNETTGMMEERVQHFNEWKGYYAMQHAEKGLAWWNETEKIRQEREYQEMKEAAAQ